MRRIHVVVASIVCFFVLGIAARPAAADRNGVQPVLECVSANGDGTYVAVFGTFNPSPDERVIPAGPHNKFPPDVFDIGQPTVFAPGRTVASFSAPFTDTLTWQIEGSSARATVSGPPCNSAPTVSEAGTPVLLALALVAMTSGWVWWRRRAT